MYRHTWFDKNGFAPITPGAQLPDDWIDAGACGGVFLAAWEEHCLECAVPQCYHACARYVEREDKKCRKTFYGIKRRGDLLGRFPLAVQLKFRAWGKMECHVPCRSVSVKRFKRINALSFAAERAVLHASRAVKWALPTMKPCGALEVLKQAVVSRVGLPSVPRTFLFQCYSEAGPYNLFFECASGAVFFRTSFVVRKGYNQFVFSVDMPKADGPASSLMRYYPENDTEAELLVLFSDFAELPPDREKPAPAQKVKCVAWDLDNTVWDGTLSETVPDTLRLRDGVLDVMRGLDERGIIQIVASKNYEADVLPVLRRLGIADLFVGVFAHWGSKSQSLAQAATMLNIRTDSFALIDDSAFERAEVTAALPVRAYDVTDIPALLGLPEFDVPVTQESARRRLMYQTESRRNAVRAEFSGSQVAFLKQCQLRADIFYVDESRVARCHELVQRTNQLNLSGTKYDADGFCALLAQNKGRAFAVHCEDSFGSYGLVGFFVVCPQDACAVITEYAVSCRVAQKWLEPALLAFVAQKFSAERIVFDGVYNKKNDLLITTLKGFGLAEQPAAPGRLLLSIQTKDLPSEQVVQVFDRTEG